MTLSEWERAIVLRALKRSDYNRSQASRDLGITCRTIRNLIKRFRRDGIDVPESPHFIKCTETRERLRDG